MAKEIALQVLFNSINASNNIKKEKLLMIGIWAWQICEISMEPAKCHEHFNTKF